MGAALARRHRRVGGAGRHRDFATPHCGHNGTAGARRFRRAAGRVGRAASTVWPHAAQRHCPETPTSPRYLPVSSVIIGIPRYIWYNYTSIYLDKVSIILSLCSSRYFPQSPISIIVTRRAWRPLLVYFHDCTIFRIFQKFLQIAFTSHAMYAITCQARRQGSGGQAPIIRAQAPTMNAQGQEPYEMT